MKADEGWTPGWDEPRWSYIVDLAKRSPAERLRWLEEAIDFAVAAGARTREEIFDGSTGSDPPST